MQKDVRSMIVRAGGGAQHTTMAQQLRLHQQAAASVQPNSAQGAAAQAFLASLRVPSEGGVIADTTARENVALLLSIQSTQRTAALLEAHPELLRVPLSPWMDFLNSYGVSEHFFFRLLGTHPGVFTRGSLFNAGQTMVFLQSLGLTTRDISAHIIPKAPEVLLQDFSRLEPVTAYFCAPPAPDGGDDAATATNPGDGSTADGGALHPPAMETWPQSQLEQQQQGPAQEPWGVSRGREGGGGAGSGQRGGLGLSHDQLRSLLSRCPRVLLMSVERDLQPRVTYLRDGMGFTAEQVRRLVTLNSALLLVPLEPLLTSHLAVLTRAGGFTEREARWLLVACPECLALTTGNLERKFRFLHGTVFGPATQQAAAAVPAPPSAAATSPSPLAGAAQTTPPAAPDASGAAARSAPSGAPPPLPPWESQAQVDAQQQAQPQRGGGAEGEAWGGAAATRAAVLVYPAALNHSLLNELGPRFSYVLDRGKLHHVLAYNEVSRRVTLSLGRLLGDADTDRFLARVAGEPQDFASFCSRWRRTQAGKLTVTPTGASSTGSSWSNEASW